MDSLLSNPIPLAVLRKHGDRIDWENWYGRFGTETLVYTDYCDHFTTPVPDHLISTATHVWVYVEK